MRTRNSATLATVLIAGAIVLLLWWTNREPPALAGELTADAPSTSAPIERGAGTPAVPAEDARSAVVEPTAPEDPPLVVEPELEHPFLYALVVRAIDENGLPVHGAQCKLAPARSSLNDAAALIEVDGWTTILWRGKQPEMDVDLQINESRSLTGSRRLHLRAGTPAEVAVLGNSAISGVFQIEVSGGLTRAGFFSLAGSSLRGFTLATEGNDLRMARFPHPHARFGDHFVDVFDPSPPEEERAGDLSEQIRIEGAVELSLGRVLSFHVDASAELDSLASSPTTSRVSVRVLDDQGDPEWQCLVALGRNLDGTEQTALTDEQGDAVFESVGPGWWEARAGGGVGGMARERLFVAAPEPLHWNAHLDPGARVIGHVRDSEGKPAQNKLVRYESIPDLVARSTSVHMTRETAGGEEIAERGEAPASARGELRAPWVDQATVLGDGSFEIPNLPPGLGRLLVLAADDPDGPALFVEEGVLPGEHEIDITLAAANGSLHGIVQRPESLPGLVIEVRAIHEGSGRGIACFASEDGSYRSKGLAPGWYQVEIGAGVLGWHDLGRQFVEAGADVDLGSFTPPPPAKVRVILPEPSEGAAPPLGLTFYLRRPDLDLRGEPRALDGRGILLLPAGEYWVFWSADDGTTRHRGLSLAAGASADLDLRGQK